MPRAQERQITGGSIDPYVQQSVQQGKQQKENRILTAMKEKGATERTAMQTSAQLQGQGMQMQGQMAMAAADRAQDDKRAAEAERGQREDREFGEKMAESQQLFTAEQSKLQMAHETALNQGNLDEAEKIREQQIELRLMDIEMEKDSADRQANTGMSIAKMMMKGDAEKEKAITTMVNAEKKAIQNKDVFAKTKDDAVKRINLDKRMDLPTKGKRYMPTGAVMEMGGYGEEVKIKPGTQADPMAVMQDQLAKFNPNLEVANLASSGIHNTEQQLMEGKLTSEDMRSALSVINAMQDVIDDKLSLVSKEDKDFWREHAQKLGQMEDSLVGLKNSKKQVKDSEMETVGMRVRDALGSVYPGISFGGKINELKKTGMDWNAIMDEFTKSREPYTPLILSEDMSPFATEARTRVNSIFAKTSTDQNISTDTWGGAE